MSQRHPTSENIADLWIRIAEKFCDKSKDPVPEEKPNTELSRIRQMFAFPEENEKKDDAFEKSFEERCRKIGNASDGSCKKSRVSSDTQEFTIDIVTDSSEKETDGNYPDELIGDQKEGLLDPARSKIPREDNSDRSTMKWHPAFPRHKDFDRMV